MGNIGVATIFVTTMVSFFELFPRSFDYAPDPDSKFVDLGTDGCARNTQTLGRAGLIAVAFFQDFGNQLTLNLFDDVVVEC